MYFNDPWNTTYADACPDCCHSLTENDEKVYTLSTESAGKLLELTEKLLLSLPSRRLIHPFGSTVLSPFGKCLPVVM